MKHRLFVTLAIFAAITAIGSVGERVWTNTVTGIEQKTATRILSAYDPVQEATYLAHGWDKAKLTTSHSTRTARR